MWKRKKVNHANVLVELQLQGRKKGFITIQHIDICNRCSIKTFRVVESKVYLFRKGNDKSSDVI